VSDFISLNAKQLGVVQRLGFCDGSYESCDCSDDGVVAMDDQSPEFTNVDGYQDAFVNLAVLGGEPKAIDAIDLSMIQDMKVLAEIIASDPSYKVVAARKAPLQYKHKEVKPMGLQPGIPPRHFRRLTYYAQLALSKLVDPALKPDGVYGDDTLRVVGIFQKKVGMSQNDGTMLGPRTIGTLIMKCRYSASEMISKLKDDAYLLKESGPFIVDSAPKEYESVYANLVIALKWLGYVDESSDGKLKNAVRHAMYEHFDKTTKIGPKVIGWIIDRIKSQSFKTVKLS